MSKGFDYETLTYESREEIHNALAETTMKHINANQALFSPLEFDVAKHPSQRLEVVHLEPAPTSPEEVDGLAHTAAPSLFPFLVDETKQNEGIFRSMQLYLDSGESVHVLVSPHLKMDDLPELSVAIGQLMSDQWQDQNGEIISRGVSTIGAFGMAASEVVEKTGHVFMSFPRTSSIEKVKKTLETRGIDIDVDGLVSTNNKRMREAINEWKGKRLFHRIGKQAIGKSLQIAWEGATPNIDYIDGEKIDRIALNPISKGTFELIKNDYVLPVILWSDAENPILRFGPIQRVHKQEDVDNIHRWQAHTLARDLSLPAANVVIE